MNEFDVLYREACAALEQGAQRAKHPYHLMSAACVNELGAPELRTVVLRRVEPELRRILFHTDYRSPKVAWLQQNSAISLLFYDTQTRQQLRFRARAKVHYQDALCEQQWGNTSANSKLCYTAPQGSGATVAAPEGCGIDSRAGGVAEGEEDAAAYTNFAVIGSVYQGLDVVRLDHRGHLRACLQWNENDQMHASWLAV